MTLSLCALDGPLRDEAARAAAVAPHLSPQHHPVWIDVLERCGEEMIGAAALRDGRLAGWILAAARTRAPGTVLTSLPYVAYGGPALIRPDDDETGAALCGWLAKAAADRGAAAVTLGLSPFVEPAEAERIGVALGWGEAFRFDNFAQVQRLQPHPLSQLPKSRRDKLASGIRRAAREGVEAEPCDNADLFGQWLDIYRARYAQIGAKPLPDNFHRAAFDYGRPAGAVEFWAARKSGRLIGGTLLLLGAAIVDYFSSAFLMDEDLRLLAPNNLLLDRAFESLGARGRRWFNWQSSPGREGVYRFKAGWGAEERPQLYLGAIAPGEPGRRVTASSPEELGSAYPARFVLPFSRLAGAAAEER